MPTKTRIHKAIIVFARNTGSAYHTTLDCPIINSPTVNASQYKRIKLKAAREKKLAPCFICAR